MLPEPDVEEERRQRERERGFSIEILRVLDPAENSSQGVAQCFVSLVVIERDYEALGFMVVVVLIFLDGLDGLINDTVASL